MDLESLTARRAEIIRVREIHRSNALRCEGALDLLDEQLNALQEDAARQREAEAEAAPPSDDAATKRTKKKNITKFPARKPA